MPADDRMPPDPWAEDGVDLWGLEQAEQLAHEGAAESDPRWERIDGPTTDEFVDAELELRIERQAEETDLGALVRRAVLASVAVVAALALLLLVLR